MWLNVNPRTAIFVIITVVSRWIHCSFINS